MNGPGGVWFHPGLQGAVRGPSTSRCSPKARCSGPVRRSRPETQSFLGEWPCAVLPDEIEAGNIRAFLNFGGAILASFPDRNRLEPALRSLELLVTTDIVMTPTAAISTHVLPTKDQLERADVSLWDFLTPRVSMQHTPAVVATGRRAALGLVGVRRDRAAPRPRPGAGRRRPTTSMLARIVAGRPVQLGRARRHRRGRGCRSRFRCRGSSATSSGRVAGGSRRRCSSSSWRRSNRRDARAHPAPAGRRSSTPRSTTSASAPRCIMHPDDAAQAGVDRRRRQCSSGPRAASSSVWPRSTRRIRRGVDLRPARPSRRQRQRPYRQGRPRHRHRHGPLQRRPRHHSGAALTNPGSC